MLSPLQTPARERSYQYETTSKERALAFVTKLRAAGYAHMKGKLPPFTLMPEMTFSTRTYIYPGQRPVYSMTWAYSKNAPTPPRRKYGRDLCLECGERRQHTRGKCTTCRSRELYQNDAEFRARKRASVLARGEAIRQNSRESGARRMRRMREDPEFRAAENAKRRAWRARRKARLEEMLEAA